MLHDKLSIKTAEAVYGKTFSITGVLERNRDEVVAQLEGLGGTFHKSVKKGTDFLIVGEKVGQGKLTAAAKFGVEVITEKSFWFEVEAENDTHIIFCF